MANSIIFFSLFICAAVFAQTEEKPQWAPRSEKYRNMRDELGRKQGLWKYYSFSKVLQYEVTFLNDVKHGPCIRHNASTGIVIEESNYFNGRRDGDYKKYNYNGTLIAEGEYTDGRKSGSWATYFPVNGEKRTEGAYDQGGHKDGAWRYYSSKGKLTAEGEYKGGVREGTWMFYNEDGSQSQEKKFIKGKEIGAVSNNPSNIIKTKPNKKSNQPNPQNQPNQPNQPNPNNN